MGGQHYPTICIQICTRKDSAVILNLNTRTATNWALTLTAYKRQKPHELVNVNTRSLHQGIHFHTLVFISYTNINN